MTTLTTATRNAVRDMLDNRGLATEFRYQLHRGRAGLLPSLMREFAEDLDRALRFWGRGEEDLARRAEILADGADEHINALLERLNYKEQVAERWEDMATSRYAEIKSAAERFAAGVVIESALEDCIDPHTGHFVYILWGATAPVYVGESGNVLYRVGQHMRDPARREVTRNVQVLRCEDRRHALQLEKVLIQRYQPRFNVLHRDPDHSTT